MMSKAEIKDTFVGDFPAIDVTKILSYCKMEKTPLFNEAQNLIKDGNILSSTTKSQSNR